MKRTALLFLLFFITKLWCQPSPQFIVQDGQNAAAVAFNGDASLLATGSHDGIRIWDTAKKHIVKSFDGFQGSVTCLVFHPTRNTLFACANIYSDVFDLLAWNLETDSLLAHTRDIEGNANTLVFSPKGTYLALGGGDRISDNAAGTFTIIAHESRWNFAVDTLPGAVLKIQFSQDERYCILSTKTGHLLVFDLTEKQWATRIQVKNLTAFDLRPDGKELATANSGQRLSLWEFPNMRLKKKLDCSFAIETLCYHPSKNNLISCIEQDFGLSKTRVGTLNLNTEKWENQAENTFDFFHAQAFSPDRKLYIGTHYNWLEIWHLDKPERTWTPQKHNTDPQVFVVHDSSRQVAAAGGDPFFNNDITIKLWDLRTASLTVLAGHLSPVKALDFHTSGKRLLSAGDDRLVLEWDFEAKKYVRSFPLEDSPFGVFYLEKGDGFICISINGQLGKWEMGTILPIKKANLPGSYVRKVALSKDFQRLAIASTDGVLRLVNVNTLVTEDSFKLPNKRVSSLDFNEKGNLLAVGMSKSMTLVLDLDRREKLWHSRLSPDEDVAICRFHPDGRLVVMLTQSGAYQWVSLEPMVQVGTMKGLGEQCGEMQWLQKGSEFMALNNGKISLFRGMEKVADFYVMDAVGRLVLSPNGYFLADEIGAKYLIAKQNGRVMKSGEMMRHHVPGQILHDLNPENPPPPADLDVSKKPLPFDTTSIVLSPALETPTLPSDFPEIAFILRPPQPYSSNIELTLQLGHRDVASVIKKSDALKLLATCTYEGEIKLWDLKSKKLLKTLNDGGNGEHDLVFDEQGKKLISVSYQQYEGTVKTTIWDLSNYDSLHLKPGSLMGFTPDRRKIAIVRNGYVHPGGKREHLFAVFEEGKLVKNVGLSANLQRQVSKLIYTPDARYLIIAFTDGEIWFQETTEYQTIASMQAHSGNIKSWLVAADGERLFTLGEDNWLRCFVLTKDGVQEGWKEKLPIKKRTVGFEGQKQQQDGSAISIALSDDGELLGCLYNWLELKYFNPKTGAVKKSFSVENWKQRKQSLFNFSGNLADFQFADNAGSFYAIQYSNVPSLYSIKEYVYDDFSQTSGLNYELEFLKPSGELFFREGYNERWFSWNLAEMQTQPLSQEKIFAIRPDEQLVKAEVGIWVTLTAARDTYYQRTGERPVENLFKKQGYELNVFVLPSGKLLASTLLDMPEFQVREIWDYAPATQLLALLQDGNYLHVYDGQGKLVFRMEVKLASKNSETICFSTDGKYLLVSQDDYPNWQFQVFETSTWKKTYEYVQPMIYLHHFVAWLDSTQALVHNFYDAATEKRILRTIDLSTGKSQQLSAFYQAAGDNFMVASYAYLPAKKQLILAEPSGKLWLIDLNDGSILSHWNNTESVTDMSLSPDGSLLLTQDMSRVCKIWKTGTDQPLMTFLGLDDGNFVFLNDRHYFSSKSVGEHAFFSRKGKVYPFEQFDLLLNRPELLFRELPGFEEKSASNYRELRRLRLKRQGLEEASMNADAPAPEVTLFTENHSLTTNEPILNLRYRLSDTLNRLEKLMVYVNESPVHGLLGKELKGENPHEIEGTEAIVLSAGQNKIQLWVRNSAGVESLKETFFINYAGKPAQPKIWFVGIGVSAYQRKADQLFYPAGDAHFLAKSFASLPGQMVDTLVLTDEQVTSQSLDGIQSFLSNAKEDDVVMFFISGHGVRNFANNDLIFCTATTRLDRPMEQGIPLTVFEELLANTKSRKKLLILNTCHSGEQYQDSTFRQRQQSKLMDAIYFDIQKRTGATVLSASEGYATAKEIMGIEVENGLIANALGRAISSHKSYEMTVGELCEYIMKEMQQYEGIFLNSDQLPKIRFENSAFDFIVWGKQG